MFLIAKEMAHEGKDIILHQRIEVLSSLSKKILNYLQMEVLTVSLISINWEESPNG